MKNYPMNIFQLLISIVMILPCLAFVSPVSVSGESPDWRIYTRDACLAVNEITGSDAANLTVKDTSGTVKTISLDQLLYLEQSSIRPAAIDSNALVDRNGNVVRGRFEGIASGRVVFQSRLLGRLEKAVEDLHALEMIPGSLSRAGAVPGPLVILRNGDPLPGAIKGLGDAGVEAESVFGAMTFPWTDIAAIVLTESLALPPLQSDTLVFLGNGDELRATTLAVKNVSEWSGEVHGLGAVALDPSKISQVWWQGSSIVSLTSLDTLKMTASDFLGQPVSVRMNSGLDGQPLRIGSRWYAEGFSSHAPCQVAFAPPAEAAWLITEAGIGSEVEDLKGEVRFSIDVDGKVLSSGQSRSGDSPIYLSVLITNAKSVTLKAEPLTDPGLGCHVVWGNPSVIIKSSQP